MTPSELMSKWFEEVWNNANEDFIDEKLHRNVIVHGLDPAVTTIGIGNFKQFYKNFRESFPVVQVTVKHLVSNDEFAAAYCYVSAYHTRGNHTTFNGLCVIKVRDGKIVEGWNNFDFLKMYQQLGHVLVEEA